MKILQVIHGYPMRYNAGSEVYTQTLCHELAKNHELHVFTREEDPFAPDYRLRTESDDTLSSVTLHLINNPNNRDRYRVEEIDTKFSEILTRIKPDIVHIGHLNHLSTSLVLVAAKSSIPIIYTLHDFWLTCPRGQYIQMFPKNNEQWKLCDGQDNRKCAEHCYSRYFGGSSEHIERDIQYWSEWVEWRMAHIREISHLIDVFISPSHIVLDRLKCDFNLPADKFIHLDYGFELTRLSGRNRSQEDNFCFGYIGTHIPAKGIDQLITAFSKLSGNPILKIWGRQRDQITDSLKNLAGNLLNSGSDRIEWLPEYSNKNIVKEVFNRIDAIVVPSIWEENSPLVIHEAQQARLPVITANIGGMSEYVHHEINGLLFEHRTIASLAGQMQRFIDNPKFAESLGKKGYLFSENGDVIDIKSHCQSIETIYERIIEKKKSRQNITKKGPWRITFDTNPDLCNMKCIMCEEHSPLSKLQINRRVDGIKQRIMPFELIEKTVAEAVKFGLMEIIPSTMGEPLLYKDFEKIIDLCKKHNVKLNLTTNGSFPRLGAELWAKKIVPVASDIKISWNGANKESQEKIMIGSNFNEILNNIKTLINERDNHYLDGGNRCRITLQLTYMKDNIDEIPDIINMAINLGIDRIKGHHLWAHFKEIEHQSLRHNEKSISQWNQIVRDCWAIVHNTPLANGKSITLENFEPINLETAVNVDTDSNCPFLGNEAWVSALGRFDPCCAPDAQRRTLGEFGNLNQENFINIWHGNAYQNLIQTYKEKELCRTCPMRKKQKS